MLCYGMRFPPYRFLLPLLFLIAAFATTPVFAQSYNFGFPPGVDWSNATPEQISDAVFNAVKQNPDAAPDIAVAGLRSAAGTGRWDRSGSQDGKQSVDPDGSSGDPGLEDIANVIGDAAKRANPAMAPQIDSAIAGALPGLMGGLGGSGGGDGGGGGVGGVPPPVPGGFGGGGGTTTSSGDS
jgi:hypothetical protein